MSRATKETLPDTPANRKMRVIQAPHTPETSKVLDDASQVLTQATPHSKTTVKNALKGQIQLAELAINRKQPSETTSASSSSAEENHIPLDPIGPEDDTPSVTTESPKKPNKPSKPTVQTQFAKAFGEALGKFFTRTKSAKKIEENLPHGLTLKSLVKTQGDASVSLSGFSMFTDQKTGKITVKGSFEATITPQNT